MTRPLEPEEETVARKLVADGLVTRAALDAALADRPEGRPLGVHLVLKGLLSADQLERVLFPAAPPSSTAHQSEVLLADALVERRVVRPEVVEEALRVQRDVPLPLGTLLVRMGSISPDRLRESAAGLSRQEPVAGEPSAWSGELLEAIRDPKRRFGRYLLLEEVGRGGMGVVYRAHDALLDRQVALKMLLTEAFLAGLPATEGSGAVLDVMVERFMREARAAGKLSHPGIIPVHEVGVHNGVHFFTMEFVDGPSLEKILRGSRLSPRLAARLVMEAAEALHHSHQAGVIHRDVKPGNLLLSAGPESVSADATVATRMAASPVVLQELAGRIRIADFGLARSVAAPGLTTRGDVMGTPAYMAPEQAAGRTDQIDARSDVYSLGAVLYHALTGLPPFRGEGPMQVMAQVIGQEPDPPSKHVPGLPADMEVIVLRAMSKERARRYPDAQTLADDLGRFLRGEPIHARPISRIERASRWVGRHRALAACLLALAIAVPAGAVLGVRAWLGHIALGRALAFQSRATAYLVEADETYRSADFDQEGLRAKLRLALAAFDDALAEYPSLSTALEGRAQTRLYLADFDGALADLDRLVEEAPTQAQPLLERALVRLTTVVLQVAPILRPGAGGKRARHTHTAMTLDPAKLATLALVKEDLRRVAVLEPDRVKSKGSTIWLLLLEGKQEQALAEVDEVLSKNRGLTWPCYLRARCLAGLDRAPEAIKDLEKFLALWPNSPDALVLDALLLMDVGRVQEATAALRKVYGQIAGEQGPDLVARTLANHGFAKEALAELERKSAPPLAATTLAGMAWAHIVEGNQREAARCADEAIALAPEMGLAYLCRAQARLELGEFAGADADLRAAKERKGVASAGYRYWRAVLFDRQGKTDEAIAEVDVGLTEASDWGDLHAARGTYLWKKGDLVGAEGAFARALDLDPFDGQVHALRGGVLSQAGKVKEALAEYEEDVQLEPDRAEAQMGRGSCLEKLGRADDALAAYDKAVALAPEDANAHSYRANLLYHLGRFEEAAKAYERVLSKRPDDNDVRLIHAKCLYEASKLDEALGEIEVVLTKEPGKKNAVRLRGMCFYFMERWAEAERDLGATITPDEKDATAWFMLGASAFRVGDRASIEAFRKAEELYPAGPDRDRARAAREEAERKLGG